MNQMLRLAVLLPGSLRRVHGHLLVLRAESGSPCRTPKGCRISWTAGVFYFPPKQRAAALQINRVVQLEWRRF